MKLQDVPEIEITPENVGEHLVMLYEAFGWKRGEECDPREIVINEKQWLDICDAYNQTSEKNAGFFWMNYGPSAHADIPYGKAHVKEGFLPKIAVHSSI